MADEPILQTNNIMLFGKYGLSEIVTRDGGLAKYINLNPVLVPHSNAKHANRSFGKSKVNIVERLMNNMMRTEVFTGKKMKSYRVVKDAFQIIQDKTKKNPVQVLVEALENAAPREEITRLQFGGISVPKAVDIAPARRLDIALRNICKGAIQSSFKNTKPIEQCLADELIFASKADMNSFAVSMKEEVERVAQSAR
jgi:small subunit ribosomal protein S7